MIVAIDFDGTICRGTFPCIDGLQPGAREVITRLYEEGHYIIIWTCRTGEALLTAINWLLEMGVPFNSVNAGCPENLRQYGQDGRKVYAHVYVDDKNLGGFPGWEVAEAEISKLKVQRNEPATTD